MTTRHSLDLRGTPCPLNYVKTRLELDRMGGGEQLEVWLDRGEPEVQVPRSLRLDGHGVETVPAAGDHVAIRVTRRG